MNKKSLEYMTFLSFVWAKILEVLNGGATFWITSGSGCDTSGLSAWVPSHPSWWAPPEWRTVFAVRGEQSHSWGSFPREETSTTAVREPATSFFRGLPTFS